MQHFTVRLLLASQHGDSTGNQDLIKAVNSYIEIRNQNGGASTVFIAVERTYLRVVKTLVDIAVNAYFNERMGQTSFDRKVIFRFSVDHGAEVRDQNTKVTEVTSLNADIGNSDNHQEVAYGLCGYS